ncbi:DUF1566 domain-containing protein [Belliella pelovolcani]|uniref:Lcl domain-containing protein n=1 Tax=Belliella pelovolcani TaxID=529505 RepID=UPI00391B4C0E
MNMVLRVLIVVFAIILTSCDREPLLVLGMEYQGGRIFYLDKTGKHGLVAAPEDLLGRFPWGCPERIIQGVNFTFIGAGERNTNRIVEVCGEVTAASMCAALEVNGFDDWYLPSKDELLLMYENKEFIGNMRNGTWEPYWSSSQFEIRRQAIVHNFGTGRTTFENKDLEFWVRPIRSF